MKIKSVALIFLLSLFTFANAQSKLTLKECIELGVQNNPSLKSNRIQSEIYKIDLKGAKYSMLPSLSLGVNHGYNFGRSIDRFTNQFATHRILTDYFTMSSDWVIFNGFQKQNTIKQQDFNYKAESKNFEAYRNQISLNTASAYLTLLMAKELVKSVELQVNTTEIEVNRTKKLVESGAKDQSALLTLQSQFANEKLSLTEAKNQMEIARVNLLNIILLPPSDDWDIDYPSIEDENPNEVFSANEVYQNAIKTLPEVQSAQFRINSSEYSEKISKGMQYPSISLYANMSTVFSQNALQITNLVPTGNQPIGFVDGTNQIVMQPTFRTDTRVIPFNEQLDNNLGQTVGVSLSWNIFNGMYIRNNIKKSSLNTEIQKNSLVQVMNDVKSSITKAVADYNASIAKIEATKITLESYQLQMDFMQKRFENDLINYFDYTNAKNQLMKAEIEYLRAKYELLFNKMVVKFYNGEGVEIR